MLGYLTRRLSTSFAVTLIIVDGGGMTWYYLRSFGRLTQICSCNLIAANSIWKYSYALCPHDVLFFSITSAHFLPGLIHSTNFLPWNVPSCFQDKCMLFAIWCYYIVCNVSDPRSNRAVSQVMVWQWRWSWYKGEYSKTEGESTNGAAPAASEDMVPPAIPEKMVSKEILYNYCWMQATVYALPSEAAPGCAMSRETDRQTVTIRGGMSKEATAIQYSWKCGFWDDWNGSCSREHLKWKGEGIIVKSGNSVPLAWIKLNKYRKCASLTLEVIHKENIWKTLNISFPNILHSDMTRPHTHTHTKSRSNLKCENLYEMMPWHFIGLLQL